MSSLSPRINSTASDNPLREAGSKVVGMSILSLASIACTDAGDSPGGQSISTISNSFSFDNAGVNKSFEGLIWNIPISPGMSDRFFIEVGVGVISPGLLSQSRVVGCVPSNPKAKERVLCPSVSIRRI